MDWLYLLDLAGTMSFAISGTLAARTRGMDLFGCLVGGFITAVGGGTVRDVLLDQGICWMNDMAYLWVIAIGYLAAMCLRSQLLKLRRSLFLFDAIGIGVFTIIGLQKTLDLGFASIIAVIMGMIGAVMGGAIRDLFCNQVPLIFRQEIYATACMAGAGFFLLFRAFGMPMTLNAVLTIGFITGLRVLSVRYHWSLPYVDDGEN